jgi:DNA helicase-2/ATP-dependent DNA helicase PcrA
MELLATMYSSYRDQLAERQSLPRTDFSLIQQEAYKAVSGMEGAGHVFRHVIVDEYQDTNTIQERFFFALAKGHSNICVVGDDDQALYRFRGATVENFVEFPSRCQRYLGCQPRRIPLSVNYRSRPPIVEYYGDFMGQCDWSSNDGSGHYRVLDKKIVPDRPDDGAAVVRTACAEPEDCFREIAALVCELLRTGKVQDPNQVAFLYPSLKSVQVGRMKDALEARGLKVYAPRAGRFLEVEESTEVFGTLALMVGSPGLGRYVPGGSGDWNTYRTWLHNAKARAQELVAGDPILETYIDDRKAEIQRTIADRKALLKVVQRHKWDPGQPYGIDVMKRPLASAAGLSEAGRRNIVSRRFERAARSAVESGRPFALQYVLRRAASLDWTLLDAFYRLCGMAHFREMFDLAERGEDEGPICNLALISQYLRRFMDEYATMITADLLHDGMLSRLLFGSYLFALWRLAESEYEDRENPFPRGRIPFLTIHQAKGLEFPVVVLANPAKSDRGPQRVEVMVRPFLQRDEGEPLDRVSEFDIMRLFYVALSRAQNLLVIAYLSGRPIHPTIRETLSELPTLDQLDLDSVPAPREPDKDLPRFFSYTGDYLAYRRCPRHYMIFRKYGFEGARTQTAFFGSLIHRTLDDLHNYLIAQKAGR